MSFYTPLHHQNSNQVGVIEYISFFMYIRSVTGYSNNSSSCTYIRFQIQTRLRTMNRRPRLLHLLCTSQQATSKNPRTSRRVGNRRSSRCYDLILFPKLGEPEKFPIRKLQCLLQSNHSTPQCVVMRIRALVRIVRVINATSSSLSGKFFLFIWCCCCLTDCFQQKQLLFRPRLPSWGNSHILVRQTFQTLFLPAQILLHLKTL